MKQAKQGLASDRQTTSLPQQTCTQSSWHTCYARWKGKGVTSRASCSGSVASWSRDCILRRAGSSGPLRCLSQCKCICLSRVLSALAAHLPMMSVFSAAPCNHSHCYLVNNIPQDVESCLTSTVSMLTASSSCSLSPSNQATINASTCRTSGTKTHPGCYYTLRAYYQDHMQQQLRIQM